MQAFTAKVVTDGQTMPNRRERVIGAEPTTQMALFFGTKLLVLNL